MRGRVTVLVVLFVTIVIAAVLFPLLIRARERNNRAVCQSRLQGLGTAVAAYVAKESLFPPGTIPHETLPPEQRLSWLAAILPYTRHNALYASISLKEPWQAAANRAVAHSWLSELECPSWSGERNVAGPGITHYVGIAGVGVDAARLPLSDRAAGLFGYERRVRPDDVIDGLSYTIMTGETFEANGPWAAGGPATLRCLVPGRPYIGKDRQFGGSHAPGAYFLFADGSVRLIEEHVHPRLLEAHFTIDDEGKKEEAGPRASGLCRAAWDFFFFD